jgi:hypothetical protein
MNMISAWLVVAGVCAVLIVAGGVLRYYENKRRREHADIAAEQPHYVGQYDVGQLRASFQPVVPGLAPQIGQESPGRTPTNVN